MLLCTNGVSFAINVLQREKVLKQKCMLVFFIALTKLLLGRVNFFH